MLQPQATGDGSYTFYSPEFRETFHSRSGAKEEALGKFVYPCRLGELASQVKEITLLDVCYGLGYNSAAALAVIRELNPHCFVRLWALERDRQVPQAALEQGLLGDYPPAVARDLTLLVEGGKVATPYLDAQILWGCARQSLPRIVASGFRADAVFLDPFSPPKCPQLWTVEFIALLAQCLKPRGLLATYSCAAAVRTALKLSGLTVGPGPQVGRRSPGTLASFDPALVPPLSQAEREHLHTQAAVPYRDPSLTDDSETIHRRRQGEQAQSPHLEPTRQWKRRRQEQPLENAL